ncbi:uncharacterized protein CMC5_023680 [Chondromyces crocatus]|uniref:DUF4765 domain-containing protein n=2 Tax=Chondromyces crocatus TaxID=52 RepID=A0A0K1EBI6_CHOCO|nr:uncharacterized protein CMC5_023680 [Chondromyces crocatus]
MLSSESEVEAASGDDTVTLGRGCNSIQLNALRGRVGDDATTAPTDMEARMQVGEVPVFGELIEFTTDPAVARRFGTGGYVITVKIQKKYLTKGSVSEGGWICRKHAPFTVVNETKGRAFL